MFLQILTRHLVNRPTSLLRCQQSLLNQTYGGWGQTLLIDDVGRGVEWANRNLAHYASRLTGDYIWILDDDDICIERDFVRQLQFWCADNPDVVMVRGDYANHGVLPDGDYWGKRPVLNHVGSSNFIVRRDVWQEYADTWPNALAGDFAFIDAVFESDPYVKWWDKVVMRAVKKGYGNAE